VLGDARIAHPDVNEQLMAALTAVLDHRWGLLVHRGIGGNKWG